MHKQGGMKDAGKEGAAGPLGYVDLLISILAVLKASPVTLTCTL